MSSLRLLSLPAETLARICEFLAHEDLASLALANKFCHSIANPLLFHDIHLFAASHVGFAHLLQDCRALLQRNAAFRQVRRLFIHEGPSLARPELRPPVVPFQDVTDVLDSTGWQMRRNPKPFFAADPLPALDVLNTFSDADLPKSVHCVLRRPVANETDGAEHVIDNDGHWQPLALLLQNLAGLRELHFSCSSQFPPCLLDALHRYLPRCKLFLNTFRLRSLFSPAPDPYELQLVTSPCLYRVRMACWHRNWSRQTENMNGLASRPPDDADVVRHLLSMAPNLNEVLLDHNTPNRLQLQQQGSESARPSAHWLPESSAPLPLLPSRPPPGTLRTLLLFGSNHKWLSRDEVEKWMASTDFRKLRVLGICLRSGASLAMLQTLSMDGGSQLSSLSTLVLSLGKQVQQPGKHSDYLATAERFLGTLPHLSALHLLHFEPLPPPLLRLGRGLRTLSVRGLAMKAADISQLGADCPLLEDLGISLCRSMGDETETNIYRSLGRCLPRLQRLALNLDVRLVTFDATTGLGVGPPNAWLLFDEFDEEPFLGTEYLNGHLKRLFINSAMDETLARAIFETISSSKDNTTSATAPLQTLKIQFLASGTRNLLRIAKLSSILAELRSSWLLTRRAPEGPSGRIEITATKINDGRSRSPEKDPTRSQLQTETQDMPSPVDLRRAGGGERLTDPYVILDRIWPSNGKPWPWEWAAMPLHQQQQA